MADDVAKLASFCAQHAKRPARLGGDVDHVGNGQFGRGAQAIANILVALSEDLQVECEHQSRALRCPGAFDQPFDEAAVFHDVQLKPERMAAGFHGDVLDGADAHG